MNLRKKGRLVWGVGLVVLMGVSGAASGEADSEAIIKYRRGSMKALGGHMGAMAQIVRGKVDYQGQLPIHADCVAAICGVLVDLFPQGSDFGDTRAKEAVWEKWDAFQNASTKSAKAAEAFAEAVRGGDNGTINRAFRALSDACKNCHKKFREKE